jgi:hypothetical protein
MYGKVIAVSGSAYFLTFEHHVLPTYAGLGVLMIGGVIVATDIMADGPQERIGRFVRRAEQRLGDSSRRAEQRAQLRRLERAEREELERIAAEELEATHGIRMPEELTDDEREWLLEQAAMTLKDYDSSPILR